MDTASLRTAIAELGACRGAGTSMVTIAVKANTSLALTAGLVTGELAAAKNIKCCL